jgi:hypothetical protein
MGWDGMGWDGMGWDGMGWDGMGWDGMGWDGMGSEEAAAGRDSKGRRHQWLLKAAARRPAGASGAGPIPLATMHPDHLLLPLTQCLPPLQGFAYVEFATEEGLAAAVAQDGAEVSGRTLHIAVSAPPARGGAGGGRGRGPGGRAPAGGRGVGGRHRTASGVPYVPVSGARPSTGHMRGAVQVGDGPAHVRMPRMVPREMVAAPRGGKAAGGSGAPLPPGDGKAHSNAEFRDMLLKGGGKAGGKAAATAAAGEGGAGGAEAMAT